MVVENIGLVINNPVGIEYGCSIITEVSGRIQSSYWRTGHSTGDEPITFCICIQSLQDCLWGQVFLPICNS